MKRGACTGLADGDVEVTGFSTRGVDIWGTWKCGRCGLALVTGLTELSGAAGEAFVFAGWIGAVAAGTKGFLGAGLTARAPDCGC